MPHDCSIADRHDDCDAQGDPRLGQSDCTADVCQRNEARTKRRAIVFAGILLLNVVVLVAMSKRGFDSGLATRQLLGKLRSSSSEISFGQAPALILLGIAAGVFSGMLGMGGGVLKIAGLLLLFKLDIFFARAVSLTTMFFASASAVWPYAKSGVLDWPSVRNMLPAAGVGLTVGVLLANHLRAATLAYVFGFFVIFLGLYTFAMIFDDPRECARKKDSLGGRRSKYHDCFAGSVGALHGFVCGLLGISGGVVAVPLQQLFLNTPTRVAIANTLAVSALCSGVGGAPQ